MAIQERPLFSAGSSQTLESLDAAIRKTQDCLIGIQNPLGYWVGELTADASVAAGYIPTMYFMNGHVDAKRCAKVVNYVRSKQNEDGSWSTYQGGPGNLNVTIQNYFALKLAGIPATEPFMQKARDFVLAADGLENANTVTRIWLALFGQFDYRGTPTIPPELALLPKWFYLNIYEFASWSRETIMALIIILTNKPVCSVPPEADISELYVNPANRHRIRVKGQMQGWGWPSAFVLADRILKLYESQPFRPFRRYTLRKIERWIVEHQETDGSWGGIMLPWIYSLVALKSQGFSLDHPVIRKGLAGLEPFLIEDEATLRMQPATSPIWDTAWAALALLGSGLPANHTALSKAAGWLLGQEIDVKGDWSVKNPRTEPGAWAFEFDNDLYPDIDDTAVVSKALHNIELDGPENKVKSGAVQRGWRWVRDMQSKDGGWAAFDRDNNKSFLAGVPYADFMTPLDPTSPDVTAHAVELAAALDPNGIPLKRAISYLKRSQEPDGSWYGRWGVNYVYGTGLVLVSLRSAGEDMHQEYILRAVDWLVSHQNADGGWGETAQTYNNPTTRGQGPSTASQTAWALMGLIAAGQTLVSPVEKGIDYLLRHQNEDGTWTEEAYTGTGFPKAFYLRYDLYRIYFPLLILGQYRSALEEKGG